MGVSFAGRKDGDKDVARGIPDGVLDNARRNWHLGLLAHHSSCSGLCDALQLIG